MCKLESHGGKVAVYSPEGDLSLAPAVLNFVKDGQECTAHLSGSTAADETGATGARLGGLKVVGSFVGDDGWVVTSLSAKLAKKLQDLDSIDGLRDTETFRNVSQLRHLLYSKSVASIPNYWLRTIRPDLTVAAAAHFDARLITALASLYESHPSPDEPTMHALGSRHFDAAMCAADLMTAAAARADGLMLAPGQIHLPTSMSGDGITSAVASRHAAYAASVIGNWRAMTLLSPATLAGVSPHGASAPPFISSALTSYSAIAALRDDTAQQYAAIRAVKKHTRRGGSLLGFHPKHLPESLPSPAALFDPNANSPPPKQRRLQAVNQHASWLMQRQRLAAWDAKQQGTVHVKHREETRFISYSQPVAGAQLSMLPSWARVTAPRSQLFRIAGQRRLGLWLSDALAVQRALRESDMPRNTVKEKSRYDQAHDPLADALSNAQTTDKTAAHNGVVYAARDALAACATSQVIMGDKRKDARARAAGLRHMGEYNEGHIADLVQPGAADNGKDLILEVKLARCLKKSFNLGTGQSPASIGHIVAFGNTEAYYRALILGVKQRGRPGDAFSEDTGRGYVAYKEGDYHDAIYNKLNTVIPFILEVSGGATPHAYAFGIPQAPCARRQENGERRRHQVHWELDCT